MDEASFQVRDISFLIFAGHRYGFVSLYPNFISIVEFQLSVFRSYSIFNSYHRLKVQTPFVLRHGYAITQLEKNFQGRTHPSLSRDFTWAPGKGVEVERFHRMVWCSPRPGWCLWGWSGARAICSNPRTLIGTSPISSVGIRHPSQRWLLRHAHSAHCNKWVSTSKDQRIHHGLKKILQECLCGQRILNGFRYPTQVLLKCKFLRFVCT